MAENVKVEHTTDNGRRVETRVYENVVDGQKQRVIETHVEQVPMTMSERVVEQIAPVVTARKKDVYKDGKIVESVLEELDNGTVKLKMAQPSATAITKEDLIAAVREVVGSQEPGITREELVAVVREIVKGEEPTKKLKKAVEPVETVVDTTVPIVEKSKLMEYGEIGLYVVLSAELAFCLYQLVLKNWL